LPKFSPNRLLENANGLQNSLKKVLSIKPALPPALVAYGGQRRATPLAAHPKMPLQPNHRHAVSWLPCSRTLPRRH